MENANLPTPNESVQSEPDSVNRHYSKVRGAFA